MSLFNVDRTKCNHDGLCAMVCPAGVIAMNENVPEPVKGMEQGCINCGHCVAICPHGALSLQTMPVEQCPPLQDAWKIPPQQMEQLLKGRRSVRLYKQQEVARETLERIIDFARFAPSAKNFQPLSWIVIQKPERVREVAGMVIDWMRAQAEKQTPMSKMLNFAGLVAVWNTGYDVILRSAPHLLMTYAPQANGSAGVDAAIALTYAELAALSFDLGTCWAGYFQIAASQSAELRATLGIPEKHQSTGALMVGYPKLQHQRIPFRNEANIAWN